MGFVQTQTKARREQCGTISARTLTVVQLQDVQLDRSPLNLFALQLFLSRYADHRACVRTLYPEAHDGGKSNRRE
jgi:hypothetical protein